VSEARLRTVFCTCGGLYGALVLRRLRACDRIEICAVIRSTRVLDPRFGFLRGAAAQVRRSGVAYALYLWCTTTLADWLCDLGGIGAVPMQSAAPPGPPVLATRNINDAEALRFLTECSPDLLVSAFFNQRLHPAALALPKRGCINIHPSLLPEAKGVDPVFQALLHGTPLGVTVHFMSPELDAGRIVAQRAVEEHPRSSVFVATAQLFREGAELLAAAIEGIAQGATGCPQSGAGSYQSWPTRQELSALRARGRTLLRFADLSRLARGRSFTRA
jgi:methionyl-tRNA formyltransferase